MSLSGRVVIVTGGSRGIGRACVAEAAAHGATVVFCSRSDGAESRAIAAGCRGGSVVGVRADVGDEEDVARLFAAARERGPIHGVVNNAAISRAALLVSTPTAQWDAVLNANLTGAFLVARAAVRHFLEQRSGGRIVSLGTLSQFGVSGNAAYAVAKGGLAGLTREIARQYAHAEITATMVIPGYIETDMSATLREHDRRRLIDGSSLRRSGTPAEVARVVVHLLTDAARTLSGQALFASGGLREVPT